VQRPAPEWRALEGPFGSELRGTDAFRLEPERLMRFAAERKLLVLRDQELAPSRLEALAARLGQPGVYPYAEPVPGCPHVVAVVKRESDRTNFGGAWHSDTTYLSEPPGFTLLHAVEVPDIGGDTLFADMCAAYAALSPRLRAILDTLEGVNTSSLVHDEGGTHTDVAGESVTPRAAPPSQAVHPVVRIHPVTGEAALFVSRIHTERFAGMTREESRPLIDFLQEFSVRPERVIRLAWRPGTLAIWDNRTLQHNALNDYPGQRREMHRVILKGERPLGRSAQTSGSNMGVHVSSE
jgi:taurine dioxygenase